MAEPPADVDESELALARGVAIGLPLVTVVAAVVVAVAVSAGPALLVLAGGTLLGAIALVWASVRSLGGDAPLAAGLAAQADRALPASPLEEQKSTLLRALKDLEMEHALGKLDDIDYEDVAARYRSEARDVLRQIDLEVEPRRAKAERLAKAYLEKRGAHAAPALDDGADVAPDARGDDHVTCSSCSTRNDADATFCKKCGHKCGKEGAEKSAAPSDEGEDEGDAGSTGGGTVDAAS
jgi:hypothetical protein